MSSSEAPLPRFVIIGAQKSATRWLRVNLGRHPEVFTASGEISFFNGKRRFTQLGVEWYRAQFGGWAGEPIVGEATPGYMMWRHRPSLVARRILEVIPDVRLVAILRNPIDRAHSAMVHFIKHQKLPPGSSLLDLVREKPPERDPLCLIAGGWYAASLKPYLQLFGDQLLVLVHDDMSEGPRGVYEAALRHIGASPGFVPSELDQVVFSNRPAQAGEATAEFTPEERWELYQYFREDVRQLERMFDLDVSRWKPPRAPSPNLGWRVHVPMDFDECFESTAEWVESLIGGVSPDQYELPTPNAAGDVRDVLNRLVWLLHVCTATLSGTAAPQVDERDFLGDDAAAAYRAAADELLAAPAASRMEQSATLRFSFVEQLLYGWDLATATRQDATIPPSLLGTADKFIRRVLSRWPQFREERFGVEVPVSDTATPTERFVAFLGRNPSFQPVEACTSG